MRKKLLCITIIVGFFSCQVPHEEYYRDALGDICLGCIENINELEFYVKDGWAFGYLPNDSICIVSPCNVSSDNPRQYELGHYEFVLRKFHNNLDLLRLLPEIRDFENRNNLHVRGLRMISTDTYYLRTCTRDKLLGPDTIVVFSEVIGDVQTQ